MPSPVIPCWLRQVIAAAEPIGEFAADGSGAALATALLGIAGRAVKTATATPGQARALGPARDALAPDAPRAVAALLSAATLLELVFAAILPVLPGGKILHIESGNQTGQPSRGAHAKRVAALGGAGRWRPGRCRCDRGGCHPWAPLPFAASRIVARAGSGERKAREAIPASLRPARLLSTTSVGAMPIPRRRPPGDGNAAGDRMTRQPRRSPWPRTPPQGA